MLPSLEFKHLTFIRAKLVDLRFKEIETLITFNSSTNPIKPIHVDVFYRLVQTDLGTI
jgi:hypothetical protein